MAIPQAEVAQQRAAQARIGELVSARLWLVFQSLPFGKPEDARDMMLALVPELVRQYGDMAASVAADAYDSWRSLEGARGKYTAKMFPSPYADAVAGTVRRTAGALWTDDPLSTFMELRGHVGKYVLASGRETIARNTDADSKAHGWNRVARPGACGFCRMLADRRPDGRPGGVYSASGAHFAAHGDCSCSAVPSWDASAKSVSVDTYKASERTSAMTPEQKAKHNADAREWMRKNGYLEGESRTPPPKPAAPTTRSGKPAKAREGSAFDQLGSQQLNRQLEVMGPLKDSDWKRKQVDRISSRLAELDN